MKNATSPDMGSIKEFIEEFVTACGGWRPAAKELNTTYQRLQSLCEADKIQEVLDMFEKARKKTKKSKSAAWDAVISRGKEKGCSK